MNAMEKMVANMLGITPEGMSQMIGDFRDTITNLGATLNRIETKLDALAAKGTDDGGSNGDGN